MKIKELLNEDSDHYLFASPKQTQKSRSEGPMSTMAKVNVSNPDYTPGKAALDKEYEETEEHTHTIIPNKQTKLDDPRN